MRILIAEDEKKVSNFIRNGLVEAGYAVDQVFDGNHAFDWASSRGYDAIVMDIMMPGRDGLSVLKTLRERRVNTPILILTARGEVSERIEGMELGADDYMAKPFAIRELLARVAALVRRGSPEPALILCVEDLEMNVRTHEVSRAGKPLELTPREYALLEYFMRSPDRVLSRVLLCEHVWGYNVDTGTQVVDSYIRRLRRKIDDPYEMKLIQTVKGVGYALRSSKC